MDWYYIVVLALAAAALGVMCAEITWRWLGRRRDQRRPEARPAEAKRWPHRLDDPEAKRQRANGARSSGATGTSGDAKNG